MLNGGELIGLNTSYYNIRDNGILSVEFGVLLFCRIQFGSWRVYQFDSQSSRCGTNHIGVFRLSLCFPFLILSI